MTDTPRSRPSHTPKQEWSPEIKQLAYELWWLKCSGNAARVADVLKSGSEGVSVDIPARNIQRWAAQENWLERSINDFKALAPSMRQNMFRDMMMTAKMGLEQLQTQVASGAQIDKNLLALVVSFADRVGFSPVAKNDAARVLDDVKPTTKALPDLSKLTPDELAALEASYRSSRP